MAISIGLSSYSLHRAMKAGELSLVDVPAWVAAHGGEHVEIAAVAFDLVEDQRLLERLCVAVERAGIPVSGYCIGAQFIGLDAAALDTEIARVQRHVDVARRLGARFMRHDAASRPREEAADERRFERDLPVIVEACRRVADYAAEREVVTSIENHGFYLQDAARVRRVVEAVDRVSFRSTVDVGNFLCADEDPLASVRANLPLASFIHFKDFYRRQQGEAGFVSRGGQMLAGAPLGTGIVDLPAIAAAIGEAGYDGFISVEYEAAEPDCRIGAERGLAYVRSLFA